MISVEGLEKRYGKIPAVRGISFTVDAGEIVGLLGRNGAGKTTTLQCLAGITRPDAGVVRLGGATMRDAPLDVKRRLAFIPDEPEFFNYLTVEEHVAFFRQLYAGATELDPDPLHTYGLDEKREAFPDELSRGMRQKLALACMLWRQADALLFDEPLTGLDPSGIEEVKAIIRSRAAAGAAVLLSSHLLHLVRELCSRVLVLELGVLAANEPIASSAPSLPEDLERFFRAPEPGMPAR